MGAWKAEYDLFHWQGNCETTEVMLFPLSHTRG